MRTQDNGAAASESRPARRRRWCRRNSSMEKAKNEKINTSGSAGRSDAGEGGLSKVKSPTPRSDCSPSSNSLQGTLAVSRTPNNFDPNTRTEMEPSANIDSNANTDTNSLAAASDSRLARRRRWCRRSSSTSTKHSRNQKINISASERGSSEARKYGLSKDESPTSFCDRSPSSNSFQTPPASSSTKRNFDSNTITETETNTKASTDNINPNAAPPNSNRNTNTKSLAAASESRPARRRRWCRRNSSTKSARNEEINMRESRSEVAWTDC